MLKSKWGQAAWQSAAILIIAGILGFFLLSGLWIPGAILLGNLLLLSFFCALVFNMSRGLNVSCGCFSTRPEMNPITVLYILRDLAFLLLACYLFFKSVLRPGT